MTPLRHGRMPGVEQHHALPPLEAHARRRRPSAARRAAPSRDRRSCGRRPRCGSPARPGTATRTPLVAEEAGALLDAVDVPHTGATGHVRDREALDGEPAIELVATDQDPGGRGVPVDLTVGRRAGVHHLIRVAAIQNGSSSTSSSSGRDARASSCQVVVRGLDQLLDQLVPVRARVLQQVRPGLGQRVHPLLVPAVQSLRLRRVNQHRERPVTAERRPRPGRSPGRAGGSPAARSTRVSSARVDLSRRRSPRRRSCRAPRRSTVPPV